ncbi:MAG TPA: DUF2207 domain-containing protein [Terriglobales bacterium]|nr:DUF2207 domain-containing protein [Terriglobales bacterium]
MATIVAFSVPLPAVARSWRVADFNDTIAVAADGSTAVHERLTLVFIGQFQGIHRTIPVEYPGPRGTNYTLYLTVTGVTDGNGNKLRYESHTSNGYRDLKIFIPGAFDTTRTVEIDYSLRNAIRYFDDHDEFYWNVTGNDWPVPIDHASATVQLPSAAAGSLRAQAFTGVYGSHEREATSNVNGSDVSFETTNPLPMRGGLTIDIFIPKGILQAPSAFTKAVWFLGSNPIVFLPFVTFGVMFVFWWYKGRDPDPGLSVAPMYEPPPGLTPAEAGTLIDDKVDPRDITCTLVDLAVRGFVKIEEVDDKGLVFHHKDYIFHLLKPREQWTGLAPHERVMLENVFSGGSQTRLSSLKNRFYTAIPVIRQDVMSQLRQKGMYLLDPDSANAYSIGAAVLIIAPFAIAQFTGYKDVFSSVGPLIVSGIISAIVWWLFARQMKARTVKGGRTRVAILGFQEFMNRVDADRLKRMPPDTFEKYLPFAMALGVEHVWAQKFAGIIQNPPTWYTSPAGYPTGFNPIFFSNSMHSMATDMHQVFVSAPRASSTGSGFGGGGFGGGGGFSGGGFGGGGGSAF